MYVTKYEGPLLDKALQDLSVGDEFKAMNGKQELLFIVTDKEWSTGKTVAGLKRITDKHGRHVWPLI